LVTAACDRLASALLATFALVGFASTAAAQAPTPADAAFKRGRELLKAGKYADACIEFEHSNKLDPQLGTAFNIAQCSEKVGKLARALEVYRDLLARDTNAQRKTVVADAIPKLEARVPKLVVKAATKPAGLLVTLQPAQSVIPPRPIEVNAPIEMDLGEYVIIAKGGGITDWTGTARIDTEAKTTTVELPVPAPAEAKPQPIVSKPAEPDDGDDDDDDDDDAPPASGKSSRKLIAYGALGLGGAAVIGGAIFGSMANSKWTEAKDVCGGTTCATQADVDRANEIADDARGKATLSTVFFVAGAAAVATGVVLWVTAPSEHEVQVSAAPTTGGAGVTFSGRF